MQRFQTENWQDGVVVVVVVVVQPSSEYPTFLFKKVVWKD